MIDSETISDSRLSFRARGVLAYLLSKPDNWTVSVAELRNASHDGITAIRSALKELRDLGYAELRSVRGADGKLGGKEWVVIESPDHRNTGFPIIGFSENRETGIYSNIELSSNKELIIITKESKKKSGAEAAAENGNLPLPESLNTSEFREAWVNWMKLRKQYKKEQSAHLLTLKRLSAFRVEFATLLVETATSNDYQGAIFSDTEVNYERWLRLSFNAEKEASNPNSVRPLPSSGNDAAAFWDKMHGAKK